MYNFFLLFVFGGAVVTSIAAVMSVCSNLPYEIRTNQIPINSHFQNVLSKVTCSAIWAAEFGTKFVLRGTEGPAQRHTGTHRWGIYFMEHTHHHNEIDLPDTDIINIYILNLN